MFNKATIISQFDKKCYICTRKHGKWRSWLARCVRDAEAGCSSHLFPTELRHYAKLFCIESFVHLPQINPSDNEK